jgi:hypothetical protein
MRSANEHGILGAVTDGSGQPVTPKDTGSYVPTSLVLERLLVDIPAEHVTLAWLTSRLHARSFGIVLLLLGVAGMIPGVSPVAGLLLTIPAFQMMRAHAEPIFLRRVAERRIPTVRLVTGLQRIIPALRFLERFIRPRWPTPFLATKRVVGVFVLLLGACLLIPVPLSNIPVGLTIVLVAFSYLEEDGLLLALALATSMGIFAVGAALVWGTVAAAVWVAS